MKSGRQEEPDARQPETAMFVTYLRTRQYLRPIDPSSSIPMPKPASIVGSGTPVAVMDALSALLILPFAKKACSN